MITIKELNPKNYNTTPEIEENLNKLLVAMNIVRSNWARPMIVTSGLRSVEHHKAVYKSKGITDESKIPMKSKHLFGQACDIADPKGELYKWCKANEAILSHAGLWCEEGTVGWVHFQVVPPKSGKRWFLP